MPSAKVKMKIESKAINALVARLAQLDRKVGKKALRAGINEATKVVTKDVKSLVPKRTGQLRKSIGRRVWTKRGGGIIYGIVGPRAGYRILYQGKYINPTKYAHLVEFGRREVVAGIAKGKATGKKVLSSGKDGGQIFGKRVRSVAPRPFMRPGWERNQRRVVGIIIQKLYEALRDFARNRRAKMGK